jgi:glycosyltransferase involved in cell wall biosynthesis
MLIVEALAELLGVGGWTADLGRINGGRDEDFHIYWTIKRMTRLSYLANIRLPTEKAHGIQIMEMCQAFADHGIEVELIVPRRLNSLKEDPFVYHDVRKTFVIKRLPCLDLTRLGKWGYRVETVTFAFSAYFYLLFSKKSLRFTRDEFVAWLLSSLGLKVSWEAHMGQKNFFVRSLIRKRVPIVAISEGLKDLYVSLGANAENIIVAPDGADIDRFDIPMSQKEARERLTLSLDKKIVLYKGSLSNWKGPATLAEAAQNFPMSEVQFVFIGGKPNEVEEFKEKFKGENVLILGNRPRQETPIYQKAADVLVIPNTAKEDISKLYTSPMKLFGYMAGGVPILASDLPSLREVLSEETAYFFKPDDPMSLAQVLERMLGEEQAREKKALKALELARGYTWESRAEKILNFIKQ